MSTDVLIVGQVFTDLIFTGVNPPAPGSEVYADSFTVSPGGAANRAVAAARIGARAAISAQVGDDPIGALVLEQLAGEANLSLTHLQHRSNFHTPISVAITDGPDRSFVTYEERWDIPVWDGPAPATVHASVQQALPGWVQRIRRDGSLIFGGVGWDSTGAWSTEVLDRLAEVDAVIFNDAEACAYTRTDSPAKALQVLSELVETAIVTVGKDGALATHNGETVSVPSLPVRAVDPTGAGDTFSAAFMAATAWGWDLDARLRLSSAAAACSVRTPGGARSAPTAIELHQLFEELQPARGWGLVRRWAKQQYDDVHRSESERKS